MMNRTIVGWIVLWMAAATICIAQPGGSGRSRFSSSRSGPPSEAAASSQNDSRATPSEGGESSESGASSGPSATRDSVIMNLSKGVEITQIVTFISEQTRKPVIKEPSVQGRVTVYSAERLPRAEALQVIYDALELQGIAVIETPRDIQLVPANMAQTMRVQTLKNDETATSITNRMQMVQKIFNIKVASPSRLQTLLTPLMSKQGSISSDERSKTLVVTDMAANVARFERLIESFDRQEAGESILKIVRLKYANADEITDLITTIVAANVGGTPSVSSSRYGGGGGGDEHSSFMRRYGSSSQIRVVNDVLIIADVRTNWLILAGQPEKIQHIENLVAQFDVPSRLEIQRVLGPDESASTIPLRNELIQKIFKLKIAQPRSIQQSIQPLISRQGSTTVDDRTRSLILTDTAANVARLEQIIQSLDREDAGENILKIVKLTNANAEDITDVISTVAAASAGSTPPGGSMRYGGGGGGDEYSSSYYYSRRYSAASQIRMVNDVMILADSRTNWLILVGRPDRVERIEKLVAEFDVPARTDIRRVLGPDESASSLPLRNELIQKIFKLKLAQPRSVQMAIQPLLSRQGNIAVDERTRTVILTDTVANVIRFEQIIEGMDRLDIGQMDVKIFKLQYAYADELADLVAMMAVAGETGMMPVSQRSGYYGGDEYYGRRSFYGGYGRSSGGRMAGDMVVIPDVRTNWLIVVGPPDKIARVEQIVTEMDNPGRSDVKLHIVDIKYADAFDLALDIRDMMMRKLARERQEIFDMRSNQRGNQIMVLATPPTFEMVKQMIEAMDTTQSVQRESRTYELKYMDANDMADQLNQLYQEEFRGFGFFGGFGGGFGRGGGRGRSEARFVPSVRTNSIMVIADPTEYEFIERMIKELDVEIPEENLAPRVYHIVHTDASDMVSVLTELFEGGAARRPGTQELFTWRPRMTTSRPGEIGALYGKVRFVVYRATNSIVAITNNPQNFGVIESLIRELDVMNPEATNMLVIQVQHADVAQLANNLNNLLSEGAVSRAASQSSQQGRSSSQQQGQQQQGQAGRLVEDTRPTVDVVFPWQSAGARQGTPGRPGLEERPINNLIGLVRIVPDIRSQKLIIAAPSIYFESIQQLVADLDKPEPQVQLETYIIRVESEGSRRLGWRWTPDARTISGDELDNAFLALSHMGFIDSYGSNNANAGTVANPAPANIDYSRSLRDTFYNSSTNYSGTLSPGKGVFSADVNIALLIQLLIKNRNASVAAHPQITVNNNEMGAVFVGESVPFEVSAQGSAEGTSLRTNVEYRDVGTRLEITPQINKQGRVVLKIYVENSRRKPELLNGRALTELQTYETKLTVESGQTAWLGGLTERWQDDTIRRVPVLGYIPVLEFFFSKSDKVTRESNIYAFIIPQVLETAEQQAAQYQRAKAEIDAYWKEYESKVKLDMPPARLNPTTGTLTSEPTEEKKSE
ncbi:MAG: hypothetical protein N3D11_07265 [Candidatus Sumerlaeia bacterium]|nr:hypothetical protein [Candidatus Sumerlaeia bacterium]